MERAAPEKISWFRRTWFRVFLASAGFETFSFLTYYLPELKPVMLALIGIAAFLLAVRDLRLLFGLLLIETVIGSHGHVFDAGGLSVRMALFGILVLGWIIHAARGCSRLLHFSHANVSGPLLLIVASVTLGFLRGWSNRSSFGEALADANGYAFLLLVPIGLDLLADRASFAWISRIFAGAAAWLAVKSLLLLYFFSHGFGGFLIDLYRWQRKFGLSEITELNGGFSRIFAASDVFLLIAVFVGLFLAWKTRRRGIRLWTALAASAMLLSLSRSFWLGMIVAAVFTVPALLRTEVMTPGELGGFFLEGAKTLFFGLAALVILSLFPVPGRISDASSFAIFGSRLFGAGDAAVSSRWNMLPALNAAITKSPFFGSGFGTTITYQSDDPRIHALYPGGVITTSAIEWQYLEIWLKMGVFGLLAFIWLWWRIGRYFWKTLESSSGSDRLLAAGLMMAFFAFVIANIFTPYLNHPLGWMFLTLVVVGLHAAQEHEKSPFAEAPAAVLNSGRLR